MEASGLITRRVYAQVPPKVEYSLTDLGDSLRPVVEGDGGVGARARSDNDNEIREFPGSFGKRDGHRRGVK